MDRCVADSMRSGLTFFIAFSSRAMELSNFEVTAHELFPATPSHSVYLNAVTSI